MKPFLSAQLSTYPSVLQQLQSLFNDNTEREILDNLGGAVARMIMTAPTAVPLAVVCAMASTAMHDV